MPPPRAVETAIRGVRTHAFGARFLAEGGEASVH